MSVSTHRVQVVDRLWIKKLVYRDQAIPKSSTCLQLVRYWNVCILYIIAYNAHSICMHRQGIQIAVTTWILCGLLQSMISSSKNMPICTAWYEGLWRHFRDIQTLHSRGKWSMCWLWDDRDISRGGTYCVVANTLPSGLKAKAIVDFGGGIVLQYSASHSCKLLSSTQLLSSWELLLLPPWIFLWFKASIPVAKWESTYPSISTDKTFYLEAGMQYSNLAFVLAWPIKDSLQIESIWYKWIVCYQLVFFEALSLEGKALSIRAKSLLVLGQSQCKKKLARCWTPI